MVLVTNRHRQKATNRQASRAPAWFATDDEGPTQGLRRASKAPARRRPGYRRSGRRLGLAGPASSSARSRGGAGQACPSAVLATACCAATPTNGGTSEEREALAATGRAGGGARSGQLRHQRPPISAPRTTSSCGPARQSCG